MIKLTMVQKFYHISICTSDASHVGIVALSMLTMVARGRLASLMVLTVLTASGGSASALEFELPA